jgi:hypothetical protein
MSRNLFWLSDEQWARIEPHLRTGVRGVERADDRRVISGIVHVLKCGCRWCVTSSRLLGAVLRCAINGACCLSRALEWAAAIASATWRSSDEWVAPPGKFRLKSAVASA